MASETIQRDETYPLFDLAGFAEDLRRNGFDIGPDQCIAALRVLVTLAVERGIHAGSGMGPLLGPIFCHDRDEQHRFGRILDRWLPPDPAAVEPSAAAPRFAVPASRPAAEWPVAWIAVALAVLAILAGIWIGTRTKTTAPQAQGPAATSTPAAPNGTSPATSLVSNLPGNRGSLIAGILFLVALGLLWWALARLVLRRGSLAGSPRLTGLGVQGLADRLFDGASFRHVIQNLARHRAEPSTDVDPGLTVRATAERCGVYTPVFGLRKIRPEYVALIERASPRDQQARFASELIERARAAGLYAETLFFQEEPSSLEPPQGDGGPLSLAELNARYPEHALIVIGNEETLFDPLTGGLARSCLQLSFWRNRVVLIPSLHNGAAEWELTGAGFYVFPGGETGLAKLADTLDAGRYEPPRSDTGAPYPPLLSGRPRRWIDRLAPEPATIAQLCVQLQRYLGPEAYSLLAACAVYPEMRWELTLFLAHSLFPRPNMEGFLAPLLRLPWFRFGTMPDWIRFRLITGLPPAQAEQIRDLLERLLYNSLFRSASGFTLEVVRQPLAAWQRAALRAALRVGQFGRKPIPGVAQDRVLVSFLLGRNLKPGELRYPGGVIGSLRRAWRAPLPERTAPPSRPARFLAMLFRVAITAAGIYGSFVCAVDGSSSPTLLSSLVGPIFGTVVLLWRLPIKALFSLRSVLFLSLSTAVWVIVNWVMSREDSPLQFRIAVLLGSLLLPVAHAWVLKAPWARVRLAIPLAYAAFELGIPVFQALEDRNWETIQYVVNYCGFWQFAYLLAMVGPRIGFLSRFDDWLMSTVTGRGHRTARKDSPARDRPTAV